MVKGFSFSDEPQNEFHAYSSGFILSVEDPCSGDSTRLLASLVSPNPWTYRVPSML